MTLNGVDISEPTPDLVLLGSVGGVTSLLTNANYRLTVAAGSLQTRTMYFADPGCTGAAGAESTETGVSTGEILANGGDVFYIPFAAAIDSSFAFESFRGSSGGCFDVADSASVWPVLPNDPATTGISISDPGTMVIEFQR